MITYEYYLGDKTPIKIKHNPDFDGIAKKLLDTVILTWIPEDLAVSEEEVKILNNMLSSDDKNSRLFAYDIIKNKYNTINK